MRYTRVVDPQRGRLFNERSLSSAGLERLVYTQKIVGSNPTASTINIIEGRTHMSTSTLRLVEHLSAEDRRRLNKIARRAARLEIEQQLTAMEQAVEEERERQMFEDKAEEDYWQAAEDDFNVRDDAYRVLQMRPGLSAQLDEADAYQPRFYDDD